MTNTTTPTTIQEVARSIATDIRRLGFYSGGNDEQAWHSTTPDKPCCVLLNPTMYELRQTNRPLLGGFNAHLRDVVGLDASPVIGPNSWINLWSDRTGREGVLAVLDQIGES